MSDLEATMNLHIRAYDLPEPVTEYRFAAAIVGEGKGIKQRLKDAGLQDWRFDLAWPDLMIAVECNGGTWISGRHNRGSSVGNDYKKLNTAQAMGWKVFQFTTDQIQSGDAVKFLVNKVMQP